MSDNYEIEKNPEVIDSISNEFDEQIANISESEISETSEEGEEL